MTKDGHNTYFIPPFLNPKYRGILHTAINKSELQITQTITYRLIISWLSLEVFSKPVETLTRFSRSHVLPIASSNTGYL